MLWFGQPRAAVGSPSWQAHANYHGLAQAIFLHVGRHERSAHGLCAGAGLCPAADADATLMQRVHAWCSLHPEEDATSAHQDLYHSLATPTRHQTQARHREVDKRRATSNRPCPHALCEEWSIATAGWWEIFVPTVAYICALFRRIAAMPGGGCAGLGGHTRWVQLVRTKGPSHGVGGRMGCGHMGVQGYSCTRYR